MSDEPLYPLSVAAKRLGKGSNHKLIRRLVKHHNIPTRKVACALCLDAAGFELLRAAVKAWDERPRLSAMS